MTLAGALRLKYDPLGAYPAEEWLSLAIEIIRGCQRAEELYAGQLSPCIHIIDPSGSRRVDDSGA